MRAFEALLAETGAAASGPALMRLALIRQRYTPFGGAERFIESALAALLERNVAVTLYTREWPQTRPQLIEPIVVDPFHVGRLWRDWSFARAACRAVARGDADLVQSHERLAVLRHLSRRRRRARRRGSTSRIATPGALARLRHRGVARIIATSAGSERRMFAQRVAARRHLQFADGARRDPRALRTCRDEKLHVIYNAVDSARVLAGAARAPRAIRARALGIAARRRRVPAGRLRLTNAKASRRRSTALAARPPAAHLIVVGREKHVARMQRAARSARAVASA